MYSTAQMKEVVRKQRFKLKRSTTTEMMEAKKRKAAKAAEQAAEGARVGAIAEEQRKLKVPLRLSCPACTRLALAAFSQLSLSFHSPSRVLL